jgi:hypothetical protein
VKRVERVFLSVCVLAVIVIVSSLPLMDCICVRPPLEPAPSFVDCSVCRNTRKISPLQRVTVSRPDQPEKAILGSGSTFR